MEQGLYFHWYTVLSLLVLLISLIHDRRKLMNGFLICNVLFASVLSFHLIVKNVNNVFFHQVYTMMLIGFGAMAFLGFFLLTVSLLTSAKKLIKREGLRISNLLSFLLAFSVILLGAFALFPWREYVHVQVVIIVEFIYIMYAYFMFIFFTFLLSSFMYQVYRPRSNKDAIIVLGSGLMQKRFAPPLLQKRIDRAIHFYDKQCAKKRNPKIPFLVFTGGKGGDEDVSEAHAMRDYAMYVGIVKEHILLEETSTTTYENMKNAKQLLDAQFPFGYKVIFTTSNYHVFRASIYAKKVGLKAQGIGTKTPFYFWANALIREYVAIVYMYKQVHIIILSLAFLIFMIAKFLELL
ncbi:MAG: YdcF family protein [Breznakia sp.]